MQTAYRDVVQHIMYGRVSESLNILCEDEAAEGTLLGVFDVVLPRQYMRSDIVRIGRDTVPTSFLPTPGHSRSSGGSAISSSCLTVIKPERLGLRQARYVGCQKTAFQLHMTATMANLTRILAARPDPTTAGRL